ncbi:hypothetical protein MVEG_12155 [Podila verticillata NRRL 6337]|uniref:Uncharacterized protein n=1 Tax=Podila verticillata NRRL 6337 TaxID=1069443 RepID=A0A086TJ74_9FUNG|nr:hypothetical protein MVEG_12155 [Podila verticillata NRRL 6337]
MTRLLTLALSAVFSLQAVIAQTELPQGIYKISSVAAKGNPLTGVDPNRPTSLPVHVNAAVNLWEVKPQSERGYYRLSLVDALPYTGVDDGKVITHMANPGLDLE